ADDDVDRAHLALDAGDAGDHFQVARHTRQQLARFFSDALEEYAIDLARQRLDDRQHAAHILFLRAAGILQHTEAEVDGALDVAQAAEGGFDRAGDDDRVEVEEPQGRALAG